MEKHILTMNRVLYCQVCSEGTWDEALDWVRHYNLAGTANNWGKNEEPNAAPVKCETYPERTHYMFVC